MNRLPLLKVKVLIFRGDFQRSFMIHISDTSDSVMNSSSVEANARMDPFFWPSQIFSKSIKLLIFNVLLVKSEHIWQSVDSERKRCQMNRKNDPIWLTMTWRFFKKTMKDSLRSLVGDFWPLSDAAWMMVLFLKSLFQSFNAQFVWNLFNINRMNESSKSYTATRSFYADFTNFLS